MTHLNYLIIMSDQHAPGAIGALGHPAVRSPNLNRLATQGIAFSNAYCTYPMCTPSRASFMTGRLTPAHGVWELGSPLASDLPTWAHVLRAAGYTTSISGRMHFVGHDVMHGFERRVHPEYNTDPTPYAYADWDQPIRDDHVMLDAIRSAGPTTEPTAAQRYDTAVTQAAERELDFLVNHTGGRPWALTVGLMLPHFPFAVSQPYYDLYEHVEIPAPRPAPIGATYELLVPEQLRGCRRWLGLTSDGATAEQVRVARRCYYAMISHMDELIGRLIARLDELGAADNTWIVYVADHGENLGEHGFWSKLNFYDDSVRVPLIIAPPGCAQRGKRCVATVSLIDWMSTLLALTGQQECFEALPGRSLLPLLADPAQAWPERAVVADYACDGTRVPMRMARRGKWKAWFAPGFTPMLFNMENDPQEWHDRAGESASDAILDQLRAVSMADGYDAESLRETIGMHKRRLTYIHKAQTGG